MAEISFGKLKLLLFASLALVFFLIPAAKNADAATINVSSGGSIQAAINSAASGDTISVGAGTYNEKVTVNKSGITLISSPARAATIDGSGKVSAWDGVVTVNGYSNIKISGFKIINSGYAGVAIYGDSGPSSNVTVENNYFNNILSSAIVAARAGPGIIFDRNEVTGSHTAPMGSENETIDMITVDGFEIKNNYIHGNYNVESIDVKSGSRNGSVHHNDIVPVASAGIYLDARMASEPALQNINIYNNKVHDGMGGGIRGISIASEEGGAVYHIKIYNNIVYNMGAGGIVLASYNGDGCFGGPCYSGPTDDIKIVNNTVYNNDHTSGWNQGGISYDIRTPPFAPTNVVMQNNISWNNNGPQVRSPSGAAASNNYTSDPSVVNAGGGDFHLKSTSPAIGAGLFSALLSGADYDGNGWKNPPSIGAYEYCTSGCPSPTATPIPTATATPIPTGTATPTPTGTATPTPTPLPCGDNVIHSPQPCNGTDLGGQTCVSQGFDGGILSCNGDCLGFNTSACENDSCDDSDGVPKDRNYDSKGKIDWHDASPGVVGTGGTIEDVCATGYTHTLNEYDCIASDQPTYEMISQYCIYGCDAGRCKPVPPECGPDDGGCPPGCTDPPDPDCSKVCVSNQGASCTSAANVCGQTTAGTVNCEGSCSAVTPAAPACKANEGCDSTGKCIPSDTSGGIVPCGRFLDDSSTTDINESKPCDACAVFYMLKNMTNFVMLDIAIPIAVLLFIISGLLYAYSGGDSHRIEQAKTAFRYTVLGFLIIFLAWLGVGAILQMIGYSNVADWNQVKCTLSK